ncbi:hypothetical protein L873DRAFT_1049382 [Choiromyces venosus 120613-1]|uniref:Uncharacterized protein n=1 Tax=Choiromyces venosus 120613-1 TaxID=1336337 RepID=A0A3N4JJ71_9PEZI|nr:hypothetical protein L873DRAFT_1049382 [Choiromyces venosus 120613-1]
MRKISGRKWRHWSLIRVLILAVVGGGSGSDYSTMESLIRHSHGKFELVCGSIHFVYNG